MCEASSFSARSNRCCSQTQLDPSFSADCQSCGIKSEGAMLENLVCETSRRFITLPIESDVYCVTLASYYWFAAKRVPLVKSLGNIEKSNGF
jgi:hypothetical protein